MYDCIIIGGGLSGLICGIRLAKEGIKTAVFSGGMNSLHFSSGSIDLLGYSSEHEIITNPHKYIKKLKRIKPDHPYSKIPKKIIIDSELPIIPISYVHKNKQKEDQHCITIYIDHDFDIRRQRISDVILS